MKKLNRTQWIFVASTGLLLSKIAMSATYNFYFNNTEQGNNSTATPSVSVQTDDKTGAPKLIEKTDADGKPIPAESPAPLPAGSAAPVMPAELATKTDNEFKHFSAGLGVGVASLKEYVYSDGTCDGQNYMGYGSSNCSGSNTAPILSLGYDFNRNIGARFYVTEYKTTDYNLNSHTYFYGGLDLEVTPIHLAMVDIGVLAGATNYNPWDSNIMFTYGPRVNINFTNQLQLTSSYRASLYANLLEVGLAVRF